MSDEGIILMGRWVKRSEVQMFWLLPDGTELEALE